MRTVLFFALALVLLAGCKKAANKVTTPNPNPSQQQGSNQIGVHAPTGVVVSTGGGGGSGGAAQAVRKAAKRSATQNEMNNIRLFVENASLASGQMPSVQEVFAALQKEAPATAKLVQDGDVVLTGCRMREGIWAYTKEPVSVTGEHMTVSSQGVQRITAAELNQRLQQQR